VQRHFLGRFVHTPRCGDVSILEDTLVSVADDGTIDTVTNPESADYPLALEHAEQSGALYCADAHTCFLPGFIDLHVHAPQWPQLGEALHLPLEQWLQECTFPLEARFADLGFACPVYDSLVPNLLANGTTTAVYFATIHIEATLALAASCVRHGQRAVVGKVSMDEAQQCPVYYRDPSALASVDGSREVVERIRSLHGNEHALVQPSITPRFIPSCTDAALDQLGQLAGQLGTYVQTHCSESDWEHQFVLNRLGRSDTTALHDFGLLNRRTVLAHANFVSDADLALMSQVGAGIAHCPLSNVFFADSVFPLRQALDAHVHVGLGTDIAGGPSASMFDSCRHAITSSRILDAGTDPSRPMAVRGRANSRIDFREALWLATVGGGEVLDQRLGLFAPGYQFDALLIDPNQRGSNITSSGNTFDVDTVQSMLFGAGRVNIAQVWTNGVARELKV
jgi:guanine deaminase